ncbi:MAG: DUF790 family protein [Pirellulaceae bacterium]|nr:DUF790 family protein [Pirellulaceae bacterium]
METSINSRSTVRPALYDQRGVAMAKMIPMLLACQHWRLAAKVSVGNAGRFLQLRLSSDDGLRSPIEPDDQFDSQIEADLMHKWQAGPVNGWALERETGLLERYQKILLPDFLWTHQSGKQIHLEIIGFWTPEYIQSKLHT